MGERPRGAPLERGGKKSPLANLKFGLPWFAENFTGEFAPGPWPAPKVGHQGITPQPRKFLSPLPKRGDSQKMVPSKRSPKNGMGFFGLIPKNWFEGKTLRISPPGPVVSAAKFPKTNPGYPPCPKTQGFSPETKKGLPGNNPLEISRYCPFGPGPSRSKPAREKPGFPIRAPN